jgi:hypothetical protein
MAGKCSTHVKHADVQLKSLSTNMKERDHLQYLDVDGSIILNLVLKKQGGSFVKWIRVAQDWDQGRVLRKGPDS